MRRSLQLIVILAIIILAIAIFNSVPEFGGQELKAKIAVTSVEIRSLSTALDKYKLDNLAYPTTEQGLKALWEKPTMPPIPNDWKGPYISDDINDIWGDSYQYCYPSQHNRPGFDIWSFGPDGKNGTEDDFTNWAPFPKIYTDKTSNYIKTILIVITTIILSFLIFPWKKESKSPPVMPS